MNYKVLANKWRPQNFVDVVGQQNIIQPLVTSLDNHKVHHAYLFTGTRGTGKTSIARIVAKALNCEQGISSKPCNLCGSCNGIKQGSHPDVIEIDAASKTKVEDTRELLDNVMYLPISGKYKVFIIDEVHMLSNHSFNALLKTLEEPPTHVKFLLATTEPEQIPITILSRCLQFNLTRIKPDIIAQQLQNILSKEHIEFEVAALKQLSLLADGSMRDVLSLVEQVIPSSDKVTLNSVNMLMGLASNDLFLDLIAAIAVADIGQAYELVEQIYNSCLDMVAVLKKLQTLIYNMTLLQILPERKDILDYERLLDLAQKFGGEELQLFYEILVKSQKDLPYAPSMRIGFEMMVLRMISFRPVKLITNEPIVVDKIAKPCQQPVVHAEPIVKKLDSPKELDWGQLVTNLALTGFTKTVADNCVFTSIKLNQLTLTLDPKKQSFLNPTRQKKIEDAINAHLKSDYKLMILVEQTDKITPAVKQAQDEQKQLDVVNQEFAADSNLQQILKSFDASIHKIV